MDKPSDMSLYDEEAIEYILSLVPIKPPKEQCSGGLFYIGPDAPMGKSHPLPGDKSGLTYDYWG